jgi:hypothetical protein
MKSLLVLVFVIGIVVRMLGTDYHVTRVGTVLITLGLLGRLLLYVRGLNPSSFHSMTENSTRLSLNDSTTSFTAFDQSGLTPLERIFSDK